MTTFQLFLLQLNVVVMCLIFIPLCADGKLDSDRPVAVKWRITPALKQKLMWWHSWHDTTVKSILKNCFIVLEMDPLVLVTIILATTILLAFYITKIFKSKAADTETQESLEDVSEAGDDKTENITSASLKTKKKSQDKKQKEKGFVFQHPWLLSTLKGHSGRVLGRSWWSYNEQI